jgi:hypothetical protein
MSNYTKQISWSGKDALSDSDPEKVISGGDFDTEFSAVQTAINSKIDDIVDDTTPQLGGDLDFQTHKATSFTSTGIDDNATSTAITIDASEQVILGHTSGLYPFQVSNAGAESIELEVARSANVNRIQHYNRSGAAFCTSDSNALDHTFTHSGGESIRFQAGGGISFNGDTAAANALDDYEEGTWTPTFFGSSGTIGAYAATTTGLYTKIGRKVTCTGVIRLSNIGSWAGNAMISGLPFAPTTSEFIASMQTGGVTFTGVTSLYGYTGVTSLNLKESTSGGAISNVAVTSCASTSQFLFTVQYFTA